MNAATLIASLRLGASVHITRGPKEGSYLVSVAGEKFETRAGSIVKALTNSPASGWVHLSMSAGAKQSVRKHAYKWGGPYRISVGNKIDFIREQKHMLHKDDKLDALEWIVHKAKPVQSQSPYKIVWHHTSCSS